MVELARLFFEIPFSLNMLHLTYLSGRFFYCGERGGRGDKLGLF